MKIFIMGLTASGKSSQAKRIASYFGLNHYCGSAQLLSKLSCVDSNEEHWWFGDTGKNIDNERDRSNIDLQIDEQLIEIAKKEDNYVFESWTTPFLYTPTDAIKIYLSPSLESRAKMAFGSKKHKSISADELMNGITQKDTNSRIRFQRLHGIDIFDTSGFGLVLDNSIFPPEHTGLILCQYIALATITTT